jgi:hypothetical protein
MHFAEFFKNYQKLVVREKQALLVTLAGKMTNLFLPKMTSVKRR